jgi:lipid A 4'-phosphatase
VAIVGLYLIIAAGILVGGIFAYEPSLDMQVARLVTQQDIKDVLAQAHPVLQGLRLFNFQLTLFLLTVTIAAVAVKVVNPAAVTHLSTRFNLFVIGVFVLGPGLIVNGIFKSFWGRPRPRHLVEFGGTADFMAWWDPTGVCVRNCSFVSGEASSAFAVLALAALVPSPLRYTAIVASVIYGLSVGAARIAVGAHFLSDVLFAGVFTALLIWCLHGLIWRWKATALSEQAAERLVADSLRNLVQTPSTVIQGTKAFMRGFLVRKQPDQVAPQAIAQRVARGAPLQQ